MAKSVLDYFFAMLHVAVRSHYFTHPKLEKQRDFIRDRRWAKLIITVQTASVCDDAKHASGSTRTAGDDQTLRNGTEVY